MSKRRRRKSTSRKALLALTPSDQPTVPENGLPVPPNATNEGGSPPEIIPPSTPTPQNQQRQQRQQQQRGSGAHGLPGLSSPQEGNPRGAAESVIRGYFRGMEGFNNNVEAQPQQRGNQQRPQPRPQPSNPPGEGPSPIQPDRRYDEDLGDWVQGPTVDELDEDAPANVKLNRGGVFYWHPYV